METDLYTIRNYREADFDALVRLHAEAERVDRGGYFVSPRMLAERMNHPRYRPGTNLIVIESQRTVVGYTHVMEELEIGRAVLDYLVHPEHRRKGAATALLSRALRHSETLGVKAAHAGASETNVPAREFLIRLGFRFERRQLELELDLHSCAIEDAEAPHLVVRPLRTDEMQTITDLQNRAFEGSWGYNPNTEEEVTYRIRPTSCFAEHVILALESGRAVGFCWTTRCREEDGLLGARRGRIHMLGVDPRVRNRRVGRAVLSAGLAHLRDLGVRFADLTVDSHNSPALSIYGTMGFRIRSSTAWYEKRLEP
jgi:mycothiol synthase